MCVLMCVFVCVVSVCVFSVCVVSVCVVSVCVVSGRRQAGGRSGMKHRKEEPQTNIWGRKNLHKYCKKFIRRTAQRVTPIPPSTPYKPLEKPPPPGYLINIVSETIEIYS